MAIKSITQLVSDGYSEKLLRAIAHMPGNPAFRINPRGKFYFEEEQLKKFIQNRKDKGGCIA